MMNPFSGKSSFEKPVELLQSERDGKDDIPLADKIRRPRGPHKSRYPDFYLTGEAAKFCGVSQRTIERWRVDGTLRPEKQTPGGHSLYSRSQLEPHRTERTLADSASEFPWNND